MTFQQMYDQAKALGYSFDQMRANCLAQLDQYENGPPSWRSATPHCREMLTWLDEQKRGN